MYVCFKYKAKYLLFSISYIAIMVLNRTACIEELNKFRKL